MTAELSRRRGQQQPGTTAGSELPPCGGTGSHEITVALAGNPNCGKTSLFNALTGSKQRVGNWPGVTVERKEGRICLGGMDAVIVDLPGTYGLTSSTIDEEIARDFLIQARPDITVNVIDASNLPRNLYLTVNLLELAGPLIIALNMWDELEERGDRIDIEQLSRLLRAPVVRTVGSRGQGINDLKQAILQVAQQSNPATVDTLRYGHPVDPELDQLAALITATLEYPRHLDPRWIALKLLEGDTNILQRYGISGERAPVMAAVAAAVTRIEAKAGQPADVLIVDHRYGIVNGIMRECVTYAPRRRIDISDKIDNVVLNRVLAIPIFLAVMWLMYQITFVATKPFMEGISATFDWLGRLAAVGLAGAPSWLQHFVTEALLGGIGSLMVFFPPILLLFFLIAFLEDSGYMARAAFVVDNVMHRIGLHGKSFIPLIIGFGCTVPGILATRTLESRRDRILTVIINPFVSCGARMPIWVLLAGAFFPAHYAGTVVFGIILLGLAVSALSALLLGKLVFRGESSPFVMELPPYRMPTLKGLGLRTWERAWVFLRKVSSVILIGVTLIWFLGAFPMGSEPFSADTLAGRLGRFVEPAFRPLGMEWRAVVALGFGVVAKEIVVSSLGVLYSGQAGETSDAEVFELNLQQRLRDNWTRMQAISFIIFALLYIPCLGTVGAMLREIGWRWTLFAVGYELFVAYALAAAVYATGTALGF